MNSANSFEWPPASIETLRKMRADGQSARQIAIQISADFRCTVSRSAVIGKCYRMGLEMPADRKKITVALAKPKAVKAKAKPFRDLVAEARAADLLRHEREKAAPVKVQPAASIHPDLIATAPAGIMGLRFDSCRWPLERTDERGEALYCCNSRSRGYYCDGHAQRAFTRAAVRTEAHIKADAARRASQIARMATGNHGWSRGFSRQSA